MRISVLAPATMGLLLLTGCGSSGPELGDVSGEVTVDGQPAAGVRVNFTPAAGGRSSSAIADENGHYELLYSPSETGALVGEHSVSIVPPDPTLEAPSTVSSAPLDGTGGIPPEYLKQKKQVTVESGSNTIDITYP
jgi:hypothetical protein